MLQLLEETVVNIDTAIDLSHLLFHLVSLCMSPLKCCCPSFFSSPVVTLLIYANFNGFLSSPSGWQVHFDSVEKRLETWDFRSHGQGLLIPGIWKTFFIFWDQFSHLHDKRFSNISFLITRFSFPQMKCDIYQTDKISFLWLKQGWSLGFAFWLPYCPHPGS